MKIGEKLILNFVVVALMIGFVGYNAVVFSEKTLSENIGSSNAELARSIMDTIDKDIYNRIEQVGIFAERSSITTAIAQSNANFEKLPDVQDYISKKDAEWVSIPENETSAFIQNLTTSDIVTKQFQQLMQFHDTTVEEGPFRGVFVTNKYGALVAASERTSGYRQDDEAWWQDTKKDGFYVGDFSYDKSAGVYSISISVRIDDAKGNFMGVIKSVVDIKDVTNQITQEILRDRYSYHGIRLIDKDGRLIYSTEKFELFRNMSDEEFFRKIQSSSDNFGYFISEFDEPGEGNEFISFAKSTGYNEFKGLGWILATEHKTDEVLSPATKLRNDIILISTLVILFAMVLGAYISDSISRPLLKLKDAVMKISRGQLNKEIGIASRDEIGDLAEAFDNMRYGLRMVINEYESKKGQEKLLGSLKKAVDDQRKTEDDLKKLSGAVEQSAETIVITDKNGVIEYVNTAFENMTGYKRHEVLDKTPRILKSGQHAKKFYEDMWNTILGGKTFRATFINKKKNGEVYYEEEIITPMKDESGGIVHFISTGRDITEKKASDAALKETEEKYKILLESSSDIIVTIDREGKFLSVNRAFEEFTGHEREDVIGKNFIDLGIVPKDIMPKIMNMFVRSLKGEVTEPYRVDFAGKYGQRATMEISTIPIRKGGEIVAIHTIVRNVSKNS